MRGRFFICRMVALAATLTLAIAGCGTPDQASDGPFVTTRDSAGITVVVSKRPRMASPAVTLDSVPTLVIGGPGGDQNDIVFGRVSDALRLSDGRILVLDGQTQEVIEFAADGSRIGLFARPGEGPGELDYPSALSRLPGDTVAILERGSRRTSLFTSSGAFLGSTRHSFDAPQSRNVIYAQSCCVPLGATRQGEAWWAYPDQWDESGEGRRETQSVIVRSTEGEPLDTVATVPSGIAVRWPSHGRIAPIDFSPKAVAMPTTRGLIAGNGSYLGFRIIAPDGSVRAVVRAEAPRTPLTEDMLRDWHLERLAEAGQPEDPEYLRDRLSRPNADSLPAFDHLIAGENGWVWLGAWRDGLPRRRGVRRYQVFDEANVWVGLVDLPAGMTPMSIGGGWVLAAVRGEFDEQFVVLTSYLPG